MKEGAVTWASRVAVALGCWVVGFRGLLAALGGLMPNLNTGVEHGHHRFGGRDHQGGGRLYFRRSMVLDLREPHHCCPRIDDRCKLLEHQPDGSGFVRR